MNVSRSLAAPAHELRLKGSDLERIQFLTRNFRVLQGLRIKVPVGLALIAMGVPELLGTHSNGAFLALALSSSLVKADVYYRRRFGEVLRPDRRPLTATRAWALFAAIAFVGGIVAWLIAVHHNGRPIYVVCGVALIWRWFETGRSPYLYYYPLFGALVLAMAAPNATFGYLLPAMRNLGTGCIFAGAVTVLIGLLDHQQLVVGLPQPPQTAEDSEDGEDTEATAEATR